MKNSNKAWFWGLVLTGLLLFLICCTKKNVISPDSTRYLPVLTMDSINQITRTSASLYGSMSSDGGVKITTRGFCWSVNPNPTIKDSIISDTAKSKYYSGDGKFTCNLTNLTRNHKFYVSAYATNSFGTGYGEVKSFTTQDFMIKFNTYLFYDSLIDIEHYKYKTIRIGTQTWMAENLRVTHYRTGFPIYNVKDGSAWSNVLTGAYCDYDNSPDNGNAYGKLYNWYALVDPRNIAPVGWHVPSYLEWNTLINYLGGRLVAGDKLKEVGNHNWEKPNYPVKDTYYSNISGFTALPGGIRKRTSEFVFFGQQGSWWSTQELKTYLANTFVLRYGINNPSFPPTNLLVADTIYYHKTSGCYVRLIKDF